MNNRIRELRKQHKMTMNQEVAGSSPSGRARNNRIRQPFCGGLCGYFFA